MANQVQHRGAAHHEVQPVHRLQHAGEAPQGRGAEQPPPNAAQHQHRHRAQRRHHATLAGRIEPEGPLADHDDPLAHWRMDHERRIGVQGDLLRSEALPGGRGTYRRRRRRGGWEAVRYRHRLGG